MKIDQIKKIMVVGTSMVSCGIAQSLAQKGYDVSLYSSLHKKQSIGRSLIEFSLHDLARDKIIDIKNIPVIMQRIKLSSSLEEATKDVDIIFETTVGNDELKIEISKYLNSICPTRTILASNTKILNMFDFIENRSDRFLITCWHTTAKLLPFVDIIYSSKTSQETISITVNLLKNIGNATLAVPRHKIAEIGNIEIVNSKNLNPVQYICYSNLINNRS